MSATPPTVGQALLTFIENDLLLSAGPPLLTFLTAVQAAAGDPIKIAAAWVALQGNLVGGAPAAVGGIETQLAAIIASKIQAALTKAQTTTAAAAA